MSFFLITTVVFMVFGILSAYSWSLTIGGFMSLSILLMCRYGLRVERSLMMMAMGLLLGWGSLYVFHESLATIPYGHDVEVIGEILSIKDDRRAVMMIGYIGGEARPKFRVQVSSWSPIEWRVGQLAQVTGVIEEVKLPTNPGEANFRHIYYGQNILGQMKVDAYTPLKRSSGNKFRQIRNQVQAHIVKRLGKDLDDTYLGLALGMSIGDKTFLSAEDEMALRNLGLSHILVVSSLHVGLLLLVVNDLSNRLSIAMRWRHCVILLLLLLLLFLSVSIVSLLKCLFIYCAHLIGQHHNRKPFYLLTLAVYAGLSVMVNPYYLYNLSFTLSLMAYVGVFVIYRYTSSLCPKAFKPWYVTHCIYGALMPIFLYTFGGLHYLSLFVTPLLMPCLEMVIVVNFLNTFVQSVLAVPLLSGVTSKMLTLIRMVITSSQQIGEHFILIPFLVGGIIGLYYIALGLLVLRGHKRSDRRLVAVIVLLMLLVHGVNAGLDYFPMQVYYLDVGMGDSQLIYCRGQSVLIDGGTPYKQLVVENALKALGQWRIDIGIISHAHQDHYGGIIGLMAEDRIDTVYMTQSAYKALREENEAVLKTYEQVGRIRILRDRAEISMVDGWMLKLYGPRENEENLNNHSIIALLSKGELDFLFTGDAEKEEEEMLLPKVLAEASLPIDYLKVPHHGSRTSSTESFLLAAQPNYGMISVGLNNRYGLPDEAVIHRYLQLGTKLHRTDEAGALVVNVFGDWIWYEDY